MKVHVNPCSPQESSNKEAVFWNSKATKQDEAKLKELAPEIRVQVALKFYYSNATFQ